MLLSRKRTTYRHRGHCETSASFSQGVIVCSIANKSRKHYSVCLRIISVRSRPLVSILPPGVEGVTAPFHRSLTLLVLKSSKVKSKKDDCRLFCPAPGRPLKCVSLSFCVSGWGKCKLISFSNRRSSRVRSIRPLSRLAFLASKNSSVRYLVQPFG